MFLSVLADESAGSTASKGSTGSRGLTLADEPLLEAALDDRAADVRGWAGYLLAILPGSALGQRMAERALGCLRLDRGADGARLLARPPAGCDAAMRRDGITPGPDAGRSQPARQAHLMLEVLARTPLRTWTDEFGQTAESFNYLMSSLDSSEMAERAFRHSLVERPSSPRSGRSPLASLTRRRTR